MQIKRLFTTTGKDPLSSIKFAKRRSEIKNPDGSIVFRMDDVSVPESWSQVATDIIAQKYFRNNEIDYEVVQAEPFIEFEDQTINFSQKIGADLIIITTTRSITLSDYILGAAEQNLIDNHAKISVMCVNPKPRRVGGSFSATGG